MHLPGFKQLNFDPTFKTPVNLLLQCLYSSSLILLHSRGTLPMRGEELSTQFQCSDLETQTFTSQNVTYWKKSLLNFELIICNINRKTNTLAYTSRSRLSCIKETAPIHKNFILEINEKEKTLHSTISWAFWCGERSCCPDIGLRNGLQNMSRFVVAVSLNHLKLHHCTFRNWTSVFKMYI